MVEVSEPERNEVQRARDEAERRKRSTQSASAARIAYQHQWVDQQIRIAHARGDFDDLPGAGKPIEGLGEQHDPDWWVKRLVEREQITGVLPPSLQLRKDDAELDARLDRHTVEGDVRRPAAVDLVGQLLLALDAVEPGHGPGHLGQSALAVGRGQRVGPQPDHRHERDDREGRDDQQREPVQAGGVLGTGVAGLVGVMGAHGRSLGPGPRGRKCPGNALTPRSQATRGVSGR